MTTDENQLADNQQRLERVLRSSMLWIFTIVVIAAATLILSFNLIRGAQVSIELGQPAAEEVIAPRSLTYVSEVLTERAQQQAAAAVSNQYTLTDLSIARAQSNLARSIFSFIDVVRADSHADFETKVAYLAQIEDISIENQVAQDILSLTAAEFLAVRDNIDEIIGDALRTGVVAQELSDAKRRAAQGADFDLTPAQERVVTTLVPQFIVPNIFLDEEATLNRREEAQEQVEPVSQIVTKDERLIGIGDIVTEEQVEMLEQLGLLEQSTDWRRAISAFLASVICISIISIYWGKYSENEKEIVRSLSILGILIILFLLGAKLLVANRSIYSYLYPAAALSIIIAVIFETRLAMVVTLVVSILIGYIARDSLEMAMYAAAGGTLAVLTLSDAQRINALFRAGLLAAVANVAVVMLFQLPQGLEVAELITIVLLAILNGPIISSGIGLAAIFVIGTVFGVITSLQIQELSRMDHPLLQELLRRAPGTYHHSIMVANLAEQASEKIKASSSLVRVGAFYHDVGKINRPPFFVENQNGGNPHENLDPYSSVRIIMSHVPDGLELARRYKLPGRIHDFIAEHHGSRVVRVFYHKAVETAPEGKEVDITRFQYPGPRPQSRETAIVMMADAIDATSNALHPNTEQEIEKLVTNIVDEHLKEGQLDESGLTLGEIKTLKESYINTLKGRFHMRIKYPGNEEIGIGEPSVDEKPESVIEIDEVEPDEEISTAIIEAEISEPVEH